MTNIRKVCSTCGSDDIVRDAWSAWNEEDQCFDLIETFDYTYCRKCEGETTEKDVPIS